MAVATSLDVKRNKKEFSRAIPGYATQEVDAFLDQITDELDRLRKEIAQRQQKTSDRASDEIIAQTLVTAQRTADRTLEGAEVKAQAILSEARIRTTSATVAAELHAREVTEAAELHARAVKAELARRRLELERSIEVLRAFERESRGRLLQYIEAELTVLDDTAPPGSVTPPRPTGPALVEDDGA
jgi:DivIVA domain-containing protein